MGGGGRSSRCGRFKIPSGLNLTVEQKEKKEKKYCRFNLCCVVAYQLKLFKSISSSIVTHRRSLHTHTSWFLRLRGSTSVCEDFSYSPPVSSFFVLGRRWSHVFLFYSRIRQETRKERVYGAGKRALLSPLPTFIYNIPFSLYWSLISLRLIVDWKLVKIREKREFSIAYKSWPRLHYFHA